MSEQVRRCARPCPECPWSKDTAPGKFPRERYEALRRTSGAPGHEADLHAPLFGCHQADDAGKLTVCAGWLASAGIHSLSVRVLLAAGSLDPEALIPGPDWPDLFKDYDSMMEAQAR